MQGLIPTFDEFPECVEHRFCLRHLYNNFKKKFGGGTLLKELMMGAAKATYFEAWEQKMQQIKNFDQKAFEWLSAIPTRSWCKHKFSPYPKCDVLMNNLSEAFNSTILLARDKPIISMCEWIRTYLMGRFASMKEKLIKYRGEIMPKPRRRLDREIEFSGSWIPTQSGEWKFEVTHTLFKEKFIVHLDRNYCSCNFWDLVGIPCRHAVAAISYKGDSPDKYVHQYYKREAYELCYGHEISPINGQDMWPKTDNDQILPPSYKRGPGRPKKLRRREADENPKPTKLRRSTTSYTCSRCGKSGHNKKRCPLPPEDNVNEGDVENVNGVSENVTQGASHPVGEAGNLTQGVSQSKKGKGTAACNKKGARLTKPQVNTYSDLTFVLLQIKTYLHLTSLFFSSNRNHLQIKFQNQVSHVLPGQVTHKLPKNHLMLLKGLQLLNQLLLPNQLLHLSRIKKGYYYNLMNVIYIIS